MKSREMYSNKSGMVDKPPSNLVIQTQLENSFDNRWAEIKIEGKNIPSRSNHVAIVFAEKLYIHGGYDVDRGILGDFYEMDMTASEQEFVWTKLNNLCDGKEIKLKSHTAVSHKETMYLFGGERGTSLGNNILYKYDFIAKTWNSVAPSNDVPKLDSHSAVAIDGKMYVYGGYMCEEAENMRDILSFDFETSKWEVVYKAGSRASEPEGRSSFAMTEADGKLLVFGGTNGEKTLNDLWTFDVKAKEWQRVDNKDTPEVVVLSLSPVVATP